MFFNHTSRFRGKGAVRHVFKRIGSYGDEKMIEKCNFKSKIRHRDSPGCRLTPPDVVCPGEENCILYQIYKNMEMNKSITVSQ